MSVIDVKVCSNCGEQVPSKCDGKLFNVDYPGWIRAVCIGADRESFRMVGWEQKFHVVMGHGISYDVKLTEIPSTDNR